VPQRTTTITTTEEGSPLAPTALPELRPRSFFSLFLVCATAMLLLLLLLLLL
jgi:hypothetical protein